MKKILYILLTCNLSLATFSLTAQQPTQEWVQRFTHGNYSFGLSIKLDSSGNVYVLVNTSMADSTNGDYCVIKYNNAGTLLWTSYYNSPGNLSDQPVGFVVSPVGDIYVTGNTDSNFTTHITTVKFNTSGSLQWAKTIYHASTSSIALDKTGNIIIAGGSSAGTNTGAALTVKYNNNGDSLWAGQFIVTGFSNYNENITTDDSNNVYVCGYYEDRDYLILKYYQNGNLAWSATYNSPQNYSDIANYIVVDSNRNVYVVGTNSVPNALANNTLLKLNNNGTLQWSKIFTGILAGQGRSGIPGGIGISRDGNFVYYTTSIENVITLYDIATLKYSSNGDTVWTRIFSSGLNGSQNYPTSLKLDKFNNIYVAGIGNYPTTGNDYVTIKYLPNGSQQWITTYNGPLYNSDDETADLFVDKNFNFYITGISSRQNAPQFLWDAATIKYSQPDGIITNNNELPKTFKLYQNYPNPFNSTTIINYELPKKSSVQLKIYNTLGQTIKTLVNREQNASYYTIILNAEELASGIYFYSLIANNSVIATRKFILIK